MPVFSNLSRLLLVLMMATLFAGVTVQSTNASSVADYCATPLDQELLTLINNYRAQNGRGALAMSQTLGAAAEHHAIDMATTGTLAHTLSDGTDWLQNIINHGYPYSYRSENIAWGYGSPQAVFDAWKASSGHNAAMLNSGFGAIGINRVYNSQSQYKYYWVTTFGSELDTSAKLCSGSAEPTATKAPATATATKAAPTATKVPATSTPTTVPPTATKVPATATPVKVVPTATSTAVPATSVPTEVPPTATKVPATAVPPTATNTTVPVDAAPTIEQPAAPTRVKVSSKPKFVELSWNDNANNESGYRVYKSTDGGRSWNVIADALPADTTRFQDREVVFKNRMTNTYAVTAYNSAGESAPATMDQVQSSGIDGRSNNGKSKP
jgi:uncharacterized protein YkwD